MHRAESGLDEGDRGWSLTVGTQADAAAGTWTYERGASDGEPYEIRLTGSTSISGVLEGEDLFATMLIVWQVQSSDNKVESIRYAASSPKGDFTLAAIPVGSTVRLAVLGAGRIGEAKEELAGPNAFTIDLPEGTDAPWTDVRIRLPD